MGFPDQQKSWSVPLSGFLPTITDLYSKGIYMPFFFLFLFLKIYSRPSQMATCGPNPARRPYLLGPLSTPIYIEIHRTMVIIWPPDIDLKTIFSPLWPARKNNWEPLIYSFIFCSSRLKPEGVKIQVAQKVNFTVGWWT